MRQMPCTRCVQEGNPDCVLRETRRGTYTRQPRAPHAAGEVISAISAPTTAAANPPAHASPAPLSPTGIDSPAQEPASGRDGPSQSYRDISWSTLFDHFVNTQASDRRFIDKCSITYLGESFPLSIVLGELQEGYGGRLQLHHPGPPFPCREARADARSQLQPSHLMPEDMGYLRAKGVFNLPGKAALDAFMTVFLERVYPLYPIVNRQELIQQHTNSEVPLILLHAISFIAVTFCPLSVLHLAGYASRRAARSSFYQKVKALFDSGYEMNKIVTLQSAILMPFWGGCPNDYWNFYSWLSTAVTIAEAVGIHRSTATTNMQPQDKSLLRRLWWILVVRDGVCSALVGRPFRIDMDQSDTEMLVIEDFAHDATVPNFLDDPRHQKYGEYQIQTAKLSLILRSIIMSRFYPGRPAVTSESLHTLLDHWKEDLSPSLTWQDDAPDHLDPFSTSLSVHYNHHLILIYFGHIPDGKQCRHDEHEREEIADAAAQNITTVVCAIVTRSSVLLMPHELFHGLFLAQGVSYAKVKSPDNLVARLGRSALNNCQMALQAISECWDPAPWIMQLFDSLSARCSVPPSMQVGPSSHVAGTGDASALNGVLDSTPDAGVFSSLLGGDPWQWNPMLSSLFDMPPETIFPE